MTNKTAMNIPIGLKIAAAYLVAVGVIGLIFPLTGLGPNHAEFEAQSVAFKAGAYFRSGFLDLAFLVCGIGLFMRKAKARKAALIVLVIGAYYTGSEFAWGFAQGRPSINVLLMSCAIVTAWNAIWFYLIYKQSSAEVLS
jgi:hypothetical protein